MDFAFILDPLPALKAYKDSSVAMMRALAKRGHAIATLGPADLRWEQGAVRAPVRPVELFDEDDNWYSEGDAKLARLADFDAVLMRKDPPFDLEYLYATHLLDLAEREGARVFNRPQAMRDYNEKLAIAKFAEYTAPTLRDTRHRSAARVHRRAAGHHRQAARRHGRHVDFPRAARRPEPERDRREVAQHGAARSWSSATFPRSPTATSAC